MDKRRSARVSLKKIVLWAMAALVVLASPAVAQQSFRDLVAQEGLGWALGRWAATTDDGQTIQLTYRWELDGHLITCDFKMGEAAYRGMIYFVPSEERVLEVGVGNDGKTSKATWEPQDGKLVCKREQVNSWGEVEKMAIVFSKGDGRTLNTALHSMDQYGDLSDEPWATLEFKPQKRQPRKAGAKAKRANK
ncbi:MAG: hypothetical protein JSU70_17520 [Phycisphaerales bacterium]|nr:MAG: hypothetical protein JSU70_17520 [Phycisphaerales bacterium]